MPSKQPMNLAAEIAADSLRRIGVTLNNVSAIIAEHVRHVGQSSAFELREMLQPEVARLRVDGQPALADAVAALGEMEANNA